ncbi:MAG: AraC family transcriptional regulator [Anaerolineales bacterium]
MLTDVQTLQDHSERIEDVVDYIHRHISEPLDRETLASIAGFSIPHFHRVFTAHVGESAIGYIRRMRLERAARKLRMGAVDITEVALAAGYDTHAAFSKAFRQQFGLSPSEFRQLDCWIATQLLRKG